MSEEAASLLLALVVVGDVMLGVVMTLMIYSHFRVRDAHEEYIREMRDEDEDEDPEDDGDRT